MIFICNLLFDIKDKVVFFALNLFVDVEQMNVFHVALVEFVVPSWLVYWEIMIAEFADGLALAEDELIVQDFEKLT